MCLKGRKGAGSPNSLLANLTPDFLFEKKSPQIQLSVIDIINRPRKKGRFKIGIGMSENVPFVPSPNIALTET